jgi:hypothetical protein
MNKKNLPHQEKRHIQNWAGIIYTFFSALIIITGSFFAIRWAKGDFRFDENNQTFSKETGLLHTTSTPQGAQVYINGNLTSATDDIIYLAPGTYDVIIQKDGYNRWQKTVQIEQSLVTQVNALLYPYSPSLTSITYTGAQNLSVSPDSQKLLYYVNTNSAENKNGLYILDLSNTSKSPQQISDNSSYYTLAQAQFIWSADSSEVLVFTPEETVFLLKTTSLSNLQSSPNVNLQLKKILTGWEEELAVKEKQYLDKLPITALQAILQNGNNFYLSPDHQKLIYTATSSAVLADHYIAPLPASNSTLEKRQLDPGEIFIYDGYEDKNFAIDQEASSSGSKNLLASSDSFIVNAPTLTLAHSLQGETKAETITNFNNYYGNYQVQSWQWLSNSTHLVGIQDEKIVIMNYDGTNPTIIYSGPLADQFVLPSPDGKRIFILTSFNPDSPANIYAIELTK